MRKLVYFAAGEDVNFVYHCAPIADQWHTAILVDIAPRVIDGYPNNADVLTNVESELLYEVDDLKTVKTEESTTFSFTCRISQLQKTIVYYTGVDLRKPIPDYVLEGIQGFCILLFQEYDFLPEDIFARCNDQGLKILWKSARAYLPVIGSPLQKLLSKKTSCPKEKIEVFAFTTDDADEIFESLIYKGTSKWLLSKVCGEFDKSIANFYEK